MARGTVLRGKTVLVTGAGGSIGSALCRRLDGMGLGLLVMLELSEYALYQVDESLSCPRLAALGNVRDGMRLAQLPKPDFVFHCAAYKHVPMLEGVNAMEGYRNNVDGTERVMAEFKAAEAIVLLSTDKAVNPVSVMGRSKLHAEIHAKKAGRTVARLGNVLESSGSVIPKFRRQIEAGGPVTVTHPEATRYFIAMDQAVEFILDCAFREPGAYTANMGEPLRIVDIARKMIGNLPVDIVFTGLRPGEKLHEQLAEAA